MITLTGKLLNIVHGENKDRQTGELTQTFTAEILHQSRGKSIIESLKLDISTFTQWQKAVGSDISVEVRSWAMSNGTGINSGYALADKKCLPVVTVPHALNLKAA
jgi:hypothetical protein